MPYLGNNLGVAFSSYKLIDSLTASFNGTTTSFALTVNGVTPVPFPLNEQNILISVGGVPQKPDSTGTEGFRFSGSNIVFSSAPKTGEAFWGVVLAGADRVNAGVQYPDGTASVPSITFASQTTTGFYRSGSGQIGVGINGSTPVAFSTSGVQLNGSTSGSVIIASPAVAGNNTLTLPTSNGSANQFLKNGATAGSLGYSSMVEDSSGRVGIGTSSPGGQGGQKLTVSDGFIAVSTNFSSGTSGELRFIGRPDGVNYNWAGIRTISDINMNQGVLAFFTSASNTSGEASTERARIDSSGRLLVGTSTSQGSYNLQCFGTGVWGQGAYVNGSDASIKQNVSNLPPSLDVVKNLRPVTFEYKPEYSQDQTIQAGFIAQELREAMQGQDYLDGIVQQGTNHLNVAYQSIIPVLTKALQEAIGRIETLEAEVAALKGA